MRHGSWMLSAALAALILAPAAALGHPASSMDAGPRARLCEPQRPTADRASPYDSVAVPLGGVAAQICYGRPQARERTVFAADGLVQYGKLWRTGANEPTIIHLPVAVTIAGIEVGPGSFSLYSIPGETEWTVIVNSSISQWGHEGRYTPEVEAQEVGRATVPSGATDGHAESFTIEARPVDGGADLVLEWERTRVVIPVRRT